MAQSQNRRNTWEGPNGRSAEAKATELLHLYIYDYCKKKKFVQAARAFSSEANVPTDQVPPFESSTGFLADWWSVFWDIYFAKSKEAEASKEANIMDEYHSFLRTKKEEVLQQQRAFNLQQAQQQAQQQQQQQAQAQQQAQLQAQQQAQQQAQRRASEAQRAAQSPQLSVHQQQQQQDQQQTPHLQQQSVPSQQQQQQQAQQQQQQQLSRDVRPSPASSTASLPNNNGMPPPPNNNNNIVNTPQSMPANLPQQHIPGRHTASPSFSPQQLQRGVEVVPGGGGPHPPQPQPSNLGPEGMMTSPMVNQQMPMQQSMMTAAHRAQQQSAIVNAAMNSVGLGGRDQSSLTHEEKIILQNQIRKISMNQQMNMMRNNPMLANNPQAQARLQMQQQAILQQQQQAQQQAMLQQQHLQQQQQQQQHAQQQQGMPPHAQQQQQPQGTPQQQHQMQQQQGTPQQQQAQIPPHTPQQQHPMGQSPQVDPAQRMGPAGPPVNGQPRPHMVGPGGQMGMNPNMQSPNLMNGGIPFNGDVNLMLAQQMMNKGQMPAGLTPQQQQQHQQQMLVAQQQRAIMNQRRMMQQQQAQQAQQAQQQQQQNQGAGPQQQQQPPLPPSSAGGQPHSQQPTPQQQPQQLPPGQGANGGPQTPPNMGSPNPAAIPGSGSPEGGDKKKNIAVALYQRRQVHHAMQQQQQAQQQAQFAHPPPQKRQRTNNGEDASATTPQQMQQSPQLQHKMSPHVMNAQQQPNPNESPVMAMQQRLAAQQRSQFEQQQQQQQQMNSPQLTRNSISGTPQQQQQQLHQQQQQRMSWNPDMDSPMNDMQSPANNMNNPGGMAAAANAAAAAAAANVAAQNNNNNNNAMSNSNVLSFDLERFMMGDSGDFGEMFAAGDENPDQNLLMGGDGADLDPFGGGFLASMGGGLDLDNGMTGNNGASGGAPASHAINMNANTALQPYADLPGHTNKVSTAAFSIDGQWLASAGHDRKVMIWSVQDKKTLYTLDGHTGNITCARWSSDNRNLVATTSYDKTLRIWDVGSALAALASKDDKDDDDPKTDSTTPNPKQLAKWDCRAQVTAVDFAPDRPDTICSLDAEGELKVWNLNTSNCEKSLKMTQSKSGFAPNPMRFHPRTASVLACAVGNQINIIDITSSGKNNSGNSNNNNSNNIINADNMGVRTIPTDHGKNICSFDWSSDGNFLVASSEDKICVYETSHWKCVMNHIPQSKISGCAFVNGGNEKLRLLYGGYQDIFLWQCGIPGAQPKKVGSQSGMVVSIACCSVASGQTLVASASHHQKEKNLMLWTI